MTTKGYHSTKKKDNEALQASWWKCSVPPMKYSCRWTNSMHVIKAPGANYWSPRSGAPKERVTWYRRDGTSQVWETLKDQSISTHYEKEKRTRGREMPRDEQKNKNFSKIDWRNHCFVCIKLIQCITLVRKAHPRSRSCIICKEERTITWHVDSTPTPAVQDSGLRPDSLGQDVHMRLRAPRRWRQGDSHLGISGFQPLAPHLPTQALDQIPFHISLWSSLRKRLSHIRHRSTRSTQKSGNGSTVPLAITAGRHLSLFQPLFPYLRNTDAWWIRLHWNSMVLSFLCKYSHGNAVN